MDGLGLGWRNSHQISTGAYEEKPHKQRHQRNMVWFRKSAIETSMSSSTPETLKLNHRNHMNYGKVCLQCCKFTPNTKCTTFSRKLMLGITLDGEFKLLCIRESDNDDMDVKRDSTDEDSPPNLSIGQRVVVQCGADIGCIG